MKRSEKLFREGMYFALQSVAFIVGSAAFAVWGYALMLDRNTLFVGLWIAAVIALTFAFSSVSESLRLCRLSQDEEARERRDVIRPRI